MSTSIYIGTWTLSRTVALIFGGQESAYWGLNWSAVQAEGTLSRGKNQAWLDFKLSSAGPRLYSLLVSRCSGWWYSVVMMNICCWWWWVYSLTLTRAKYLFSNEPWSLLDDFRLKFSVTIWLHFVHIVSATSALNKSNSRQLPPQIAWRLQDSTICGAQY